MQAITEFIDHFSLQNVKITLSVPQGCILGPVLFLLISNFNQFRGTNKLIIYNLSSLHYQLSSLSLWLLGGRLCGLLLNWFTILFCIMLSKMSEYCSIRDIAGLPVAFVASGKKKTIFLGFVKVFRHLFVLKNRS